MIRYTSNKQLKLELFESPFERGLNPTNRWVELSKQLPWDELASIYYRTLSTDQGAPCKDARVVVGTVILKHKMKFSDREVIEQIKENPYLQYFLGFDRFTDRKVFDPSLLPTIRKRLGREQFEAMNDKILVKAGLIEPENESSDAESVQDEEGSSGSGHTNAQEQAAKLSAKPRKGKLMVDAVVTEQMIKFPTDLDLLNDSREEAERLIDILYDHLMITFGVSSNLEPIVRLPGRNTWPWPNYAKSLVRNCAVRSANNWATSSATLASSKDYWMSIPNGFTGSNGGICKSIG